MPVRLHFDVFAQHVEPHLLGGLDVILESSIGGCSVDAIRPVPLQPQQQAHTSVVHKQTHVIIATSLYIKWCEKSVLTSNMSALI